SPSTRAILDGPTKAGSRPVNASFPARQHASCDPSRRSRPGAGSQLRRGVRHHITAPSGRRGGRQPTRGLGRYPSTVAATPTLRPARPLDADAIAVVWHDAWRDGHIGHVPDALLAHRTLDQFRERVPERLSSTTVAEVDGEVVGFVTVQDDELEQLFVAADARASGVADAVLRRGEAV